MDIPSSTSLPRTDGTPTTRTGSHPRITRTSRRDVRRTAWLALFLIGAGLLFAVFATIVLVHFG